MFSYDKRFHELEDQFPGSADDSEPTHNSMIYFLEDGLHLVEVFAGGRVELRSLNRDTLTETLIATWAAGLVEVQRA